MRFLFDILAIVVAFGLGLMLEPHAASKWGYAEQLSSARDTLGLCGGSTACEEVDAGADPTAAPPDAMPPAEMPPAEPAPATAPTP